MMILLIESELLVPCTVRKHTFDDPMEEEYNFSVFSVLHVCSAQVPSSTCVCLLSLREVSIDIM